MMFSYLNISLVRTPWSQRVRITNSDLKYDMGGMATGIKGYSGNLPRFFPSLSILQLTLATPLWLVCWWSLVATLPRPTVRGKPLSAWPTPTVAAMLPITWRPWRPVVLAASWAGFLVSNRGTWPTVVRQREALCKYEGKGEGWEKEEKRKDERGVGA